jgi:hypothetical protein
MLGWLGAKTTVTFDVRSRHRTRLSKIGRGRLEKTSDESTDYNCFAFALHDETDWYSPLPISGYYWPADQIPRNTTLSTMIALYRYEGGFEPCDQGRYEEGFEKIALYTN